MKRKMRHDKNIQVINIRECVFRGDYFQLFRHQQLDPYKAVFTVEEIKKITNYMVLHIRKIIELVRCTNVGDIRQEIVAVENRVSQLALGQGDFREVSAANGSYTKIACFLSRQKTQEHQRQIMNVMRVVSPYFELDQQTMPRVPALAKTACHLCVQRFREDLEAYLLKNRGRVSAKSSLQQRLEVMGSIVELPVEAAEEAEPCQELTGAGNRMAQSRP